MNTWRDPERWSRWIAGDDCPICRAVADGATGDAIAELEATRVFMGEEAPMRGYVWVALRRHAIELHELDDAEGAAFMRDVRRVSRAVAIATEAVKLNHEIHGNTVPHLHLHVFPRYRGDPWEGRPIDPKSVRGPVYAPGEFARLRDRIRAELAGA